MRRRIYTRRAFSIPLQIAFLGGIGLAFDALRTEMGGGDTLVVALVAAVLVGEVVLFIALTKVTAIVLSSQGVEILPRTLPQYFQGRQWLPWTEIAGFETGRTAGADPSLVVARTTEGDVVPIRKVPLWLFDKADGGEQVVGRVVEELEEERRARLG